MPKKFRVFLCSMNRSTYAGARYFGISVLLLTFLCFHVDITTATRPFWTGKSSYIEGGFLYVLGKVTNWPTIDDGKQQALVHGKFELMNFAKISEIEANNLTLETRHSYVEKNPDGSLNVYRLFRIPTDQILETQANLQKEGEAQAQALEVSHQKVTQLQISLEKQQQTLEDQLRAVDSLLSHMAKKQDTYITKNQKIKTQQQHIEQLQENLTTRLKAIDQEIKTTNKLFEQYQATSHKQASLLEDLKKLEGTIQQNETDLQRLYLTISTHVDQVSLRACKYITLGMTPEEVKKLLGKPAGEKHLYTNDRYDTWAYGKTRVSFDAQGVVGSVGGCP